MSSARKLKSLIKIVDEQMQYELREQEKKIASRETEKSRLGAELKRLEDEGHPAISTNSLKEALSLHTRLRFDPMGISKVEKDDMAKLVNTWANKLSEN